MALIAGLRAVLGPCACRQSGRTDWMHFMIRYGSKPLSLDKAGSTSVEVVGLDPLPVSSTR